MKTKIECKSVEIEKDDERRFKTIRIVRTDGTYETIEISFARLKGEWVWVQYDADTNIGDFYCSACRYIPKDLKGRYKSYIQYSSMNYCPNCGADMRKGATDEP